MLGGDLTERSLRLHLEGLSGVDAVGLEARAASLGTRSIKTTSKAWALDRIIGLTDLTTLEGADTPGKVRSLVAKALTPDVILTPHCAVLDFLFYTGKQFPAQYRNGAFLANHGSTQGPKRVGYSISFVPFKNGKPAGPVRDFATGWMMGADRKEVWGRPVGLLQLHDGSLLISDDGGKVIWRVTHKKS